MYETIFFIFELLGTIAFAASGALIAFTMSIDDFVIYLKSEFLDFVYLQQNTFDAVDGATSRERQIYIFDKVISVLKTAFSFEEKEDARRYFLELRLIFTDLNYAAFGDEKFRELEKVLEEKISEKAVKNA